MGRKYKRRIGRAEVVRAEVVRVEVVEPKWLGTWCAGPKCGDDQNNSRVDSRLHTMSDTLLLYSVELRDLS